MDLIGKKVKHNKFGEGVIVQQDSTYVSVKFATESSQKKFTYPTCFSQFLELLDADVAAETSETVKKYEEQEKINGKYAAQKIETFSSAKRIYMPNYKSEKDVEVRQFNSVSDFCNQYKQAIRSEILHLKKNWW